MMCRMEALLRLRDELVDAVVALSAEPVSLDGAAGRWLAEAVRAEVTYPPCTCAAMDGYAVRAADVPGPVSLRVSGTICAGDASAAPLAGGEVARIFTGASLPPGADAVVRVEAARPEGERVAFAAAARPGENVRHAGEDLEAGGLALRAGARLGARQLALLAAVGVREVRARRRARVVVLSTGDEVVSGRTPDSNGVAVSALCREVGAEVERRRVEDRLERVEAALAAARADADVVITIGGVSVGGRDLIPAALAALGFEIRVHGVAMKPGKPFLFALAGETPVLGLPGSPSACLVAFEVFGRPVLLARCGAARRTRAALPLRLAAPAAGRPGRARLLWATLEPGGRARPLGHGSAQVRGPALADALLLVPAGAGDLSEGAEVTGWLLEDGP